MIAAMVGELWVTPAGDLGDALFFYYGAGAGVGLSLDSTPLRGASSNAGDIAHLIVDPYSRSMIVALAMPPPSHMVCSP